VRYLPLFLLQVRHTGYPDGRCEHVHIVPRSDHPSGERALARHRLLARTRPQGTEVMASVEGQDETLRPTIALDDLTLGFELRVTGSSFAANTDLSAWTATGTEIPHYVSTEGQLQLATPSRLSDPQLRPVAKPAATSSVLAQIDILGANAAWLSAPPTFTLEFEPRQAVWVYYLLTKRAQGIDPRIEDGDHKHPLAFVRKRLTAANTPASADPIGARLLQRNPGHRCHRMTSKRPVAWRQTARRQLSLYLGDELLIRELATPPLENSAILAKPQRETFYRVVVY
jgi:hypothetical protein